VRRPPPDEAFAPVLAPACLEAGFRLSSAIDALLWFTDCGSSQPRTKGNCTFVAVAPRLA
jgi:hypothetical protein